MIAAHLLTCFLDVGLLIAKWVTDRKITAERIVRKSDYYLLLVTLYISIGGCPRKSAKYGTCV